MKMNELFHISPWYNTEEWNGVYKNIFELTSTISSKKSALNQLLIWKARCPSLPSGIEATMSLLNVHIQDQEQNHDICNDHLLRLAYSSALIRFVNHMFDKETAKGLSLFQAAKTFGVPEWIIELRHDTAHSNLLPHLQLLREAYDISLNWLQKRYWDKHKLCIGDYFVGTVHNEPEIEKKIISLMEFCVLLSIGSNPNTKVKKLSQITQVNLRESLLNGARELFADSPDFPDSKITISWLWHALNIKAKKILINDSFSSYVNKVLLSEESGILSLDMCSNIEQNVNSNKVLKRHYVQNFSGLLNFLLTHDLLRDFLLELIKVTQGEDETLKCKLAAKWVSTILTSLSNNQQFIEKINMSDIDITMLDENELNSVYCDWFPNYKRTILFDFCKPIPKEFTDIDFILPIISTYNRYLVFFIKDLLDLIRPRLPDSVKGKICKLAQVIATPEKFPFIDSRIYTANDLEITNSEESKYKSEQDEDMEIDEIEIEDEPTKQKDIQQRFGIWRIASENSDWATCPIGNLPWTQILPDPVQNLI